MTSLSFARVCPESGWPPGLSSGGRRKYPRLSDTLLLHLQVMGRPRHLDLEGFVSYVESRPSKLGCWRDGDAGAYPTLGWLNVHPVELQRSLAGEVGYRTAVGLTTAAHHNQVGIAAKWVTRYMRGPARSTLTPEQDRLALWSAAGQYWGLRNLVIELRVGLRDFACEGSRVSLPYKGNHQIDALDRMLDLVDNLDSMGQSLPRRPEPRVTAWYQEQGHACPWQRAPDWVRSQCRSLAHDVLATYPRYLPPDVAVAGFTIGDLDAYWHELMARGMHMSAATMWGSVHRPMIVPLLRRGEFVASVADDAGIDADAADQITTTLTMDPDRSYDPALTPLVPLGDKVLPMSSLIMPASPHRNTLALIQTDPRLFGEAGRLLGMAGEHATLKTLERLSPEALVTTRVKAKRADGSPAGDLDVVVCDPRERLLVVFEIKWHLAADGNAEVYRLERAAIEKRAQVLRLRGEIESGTASLDWPGGWPDVSGFAWRWFVLTRDVLATREVATDEVTLRSHQMLTRTLRRDATVRDLLGLLDDPPIPPAQLCATQWERIRYGDLRIDAEMIVA